MKPEADSKVSERALTIVGAETCFPKQHVKDDRLALAHHPSHSPASTTTATTAVTGAGTFQQNMITKSGNRRNRNSQSFGNLFPGLVGDDMLSDGKSKVRIQWTAFDDRQTGFKVETRTHMHEADAKDQDDKVPVRSHGQAGSGRHDHQ